MPYSIFLGGRAFFLHYSYQLEPEFFKANPVLILQNWIIQRQMEVRFLIQVWSYPSFDIRPAKLGSLPTCWDNVTMLAHFIKKLSLSWQERLNMKTNEITLFASILKSLTFFPLQF